MISFYCMNGSKLKKFVSKNAWFKIGKWKEPGFLEDIVIWSELEDRPDMALSQHPEVYLFADHSQFILKKEYDRLTGEIGEELEKSAAAALRRIGREVREAIKKMDRFNPGRFTLASLGRYINLVKTHGRQSLRFILLGYVLNNIYPASLPAKFRLGRRQFTPPSLLAVAAMPKELSPMVAEHLYLLKIAAKIKAGRNAASDLARQAEKFGWMNSICWWDEPFDADYYLQQARLLAKNDPAGKLRRLKQRRRQQIKEGQKILRALKKVYPRAYFYIEMIRQMADWREASWDAVSRAGVRVRPLFRELAAKNGLSYNQLLMLTRTEMAAMLAKKNVPSADLLNRRLKSFGLFAAAPGNRSLVISGAEAAKLSDLAEGRRQQVDQLSGLTIWPGKVTARACVMRSTADINRIKAGEILVCPMTDPDYMPAIHRAAALVTDQGGVLCHAAIIARELQKPCIVGTQRATRVINTGDRLTVDADSGKIKIWK